MSENAGLPRIMGILNVTPDSFSDGGRFFDPTAAIAHALKLADDGADILDIGGESTRPGADEVVVDVELARVIPVIEGLRARLSTPLSIDTRKPDVARAAIAAGASMWNDVSALTFAPDSLATASALGCDIVLMHAQGDPKSMQNDPHYGDVVDEVLAYLARRIDACVIAGVSKSRLVVDPGIGFGKTVEQNFELIRRLDELVALGRPIVVGLSRKSSLGKILGDPAATTGPLSASIAAAVAAYERGATILRVHDVREHVEALTAAQAVVG
jgi:dihydropteroate synthase